MTDLAGLARAAAAVPGVDSAAILIRRARSEPLGLGAAVGIEGPALDGLVAAVQSPTHPVARAVDDTSPTFDVRPMNPGGPALRSHLPLNGLGVLAVSHDPPLTAEAKAGLRDLATRAAALLAATHAKLTSAPIERFEGAPAVPAPRTTSKTARPSDAMFSKEERAAMQATIRERKRAARLSPEDERAAGEADVQAAIAEMPDDDRAVAARIHEIVVATAPHLAPRTFYGMPAYAKDGKVMCFFQSKTKFKLRYSTFGFQPPASLDDGEMWPVAFAVTGLSAATEQRIADLVKKAAR